jgi:hypothetical protein
MAAPIKIIRIDFVTGIYLAGTVKQAIGLATPDEGETPSGVMGLTRVEEIRPEGPGVIVKMGGRWFFVPWVSIRSCEIADPSPKADANADLLGDDAALERATRPEPTKPVKPLR